MNKLARWCNMPALFWKFDTFEDYLKSEVKDYEQYIKIIQKGE